MDQFSLIGQLTVNGLLLAGVYALLALGLNVIFGVIRVLNMAHGEVLMMGAFAAFWVWQLAGLNPVFALLLLGPVFFGCGYLFQYFVVRRLDGSRMPIEDSSLILTYGLSLSLAALARVLWSADYKAVPLLQGSWMVGELLVSRSRTAAFATAVAITAGMFALLHRTDIGMAIRATAQSKDLAAACGVRARHVHAVAFGIGATMAAAAGMMLATMYAVYPDMGLEYSIRAFVIIILGGLGSMPGAFVGALMLGLIESFGSYVVGTLAATLIPFVVIVIVLLLRPAGLLGARGRTG
ncbi:MAG: branched-chain amino acid ABC transporter permease [Lautropia sp.]